MIWSYSKIDPQLNLPHLDLTELIPVNHQFHPGIAISGGWFPEVDCSSHCFSFELIFILVVHQLFVNYQSFNNSANIIFL